MAKTAAEISKTGYAHPEVLVDTQWVADHLNDPKLKIVEVDVDTGDVKVLRYLIVSDNGTIINPDVVDGQIYGSAAHGISAALGEGFVYDEEGRLLTLTLTDYGKATAEETPVVEIDHYSVPSKFTTLGQKAAGEGASIPAPAAIAGAVEDALRPFGVRVHDLPLTKETVWRLIQDARAQGTGAAATGGRQ
jgi:CO/xanthine dehydrogenase Mo-binding subunit